MRRGYGSNVLAAGAADVVGVDANPDAHEHARLRYRRSNLRFERTLVESFDERRDAIVFLQTIEHIDDPGALLARFSELAPVSYVSTPNRLTLAPEGAEKSENPWHLREYTAAEYREAVAPHFESVELFGVFHAGKLRAHELALKAGWDRVHPALRLTDRFYPGSSRRSRPRTSSCAASTTATSTGARLRRGLPLVSEAREPAGGGREAEHTGGIGSMAIVLHSHMPYVEGFGTYLFGEEWLFDAVIRSYAPLSEVADRLTMTVTPVLADQLEAEGVDDRLLESCRRFRIGSCEADLADVEAPLRDSCRAESARYRVALERLESLDGDLLRLFSEPAAEGRVELITSAATHAILPMIATRQGRDLQLDAGLRSHRLLRRARRLLASRVRVRAGAGAEAGGARAGLLLRRPKRPRAAAGRARPG